ncbi:MAG: glycosyltransferase family 2 protein [Candidatus Omnitrophica bacterium]|nr:glycosyltransferase family 2 protein [Candidatus Omnitrophota bacterium]MDD5429439.1 glycosyltransferase family 2 protein [Candidatus Omnitrophota bacterium]
MKLTVFIACFNEKHTISEAIQQARDLDIDKEIIVVDNYSTDGTRQILDSLKDNDLRVVLQPKNYGVGRSVNVGIEMARGEYFYGPGADLEYKMEDVYSMFDMIESRHLDAVFGSRLAAKAGMSKFDIIKERPYALATIVTTYLINKWYKRNFTDIIAPKLIKTEILKSLNVQADNQAFEFELVSRLCKARCKIGEVPVYYKPRSAKEGKTIRPLDILPALTAMLKVKFSPSKKNPWSRQEPGNNEDF